MFKIWFMSYHIYRNSSLQPRKKQKNLNFILCCHWELIKITLLTCFNQTIEFLSISNQWSSFESFYSINLKLYFRLSSSKNCHDQQSTFLQYFEIECHLIFTLIVENTNKSEENSVFLIKSIIFRFLSSKMSLTGFYSIRNQTLVDYLVSTDLGILRSLSKILPRSLQDYFFFINIFSWSYLMHLYHRSW